MGIYGPHGKFIGIDDDPETVLGGKFSLGATPSNSSGSLAPPSLISFSPAGTVTHYTIANVPGSKWQESFLVGVPRKTGSSSLPVLVLFHGDHENEWSVYEKTDYFTLAMRRGWIVIAPLGAHVRNFGIEYSQLNVEAALEQLVLTIAPSADLDRFYAVGFSMGGGAAPSFAARHMDPKGLHFAGTVILSGTTALPWVHWSTEVRKLFESPLMFGAPPDDSNVTFDYLRVSSIDLDLWNSSHGNNDIDPDTDMIRNLSRGPVLSSYCRIENESKSMLITTLAAHEHLADPSGLDNKRARLVISEQKKGNKRHDWTNLGENRVLNFLAPLSYQNPKNGKTFSTLADRDGGWHCFEIVQAVPRVFSPFRSFIKKSANLIMVTEVENIAELKLPSPSSVGLRTSEKGQVKVLTYYFDTADGVPLKLILGEFTAQPTKVERKGIPGSWSWDAATSELTLYEPATDGFVKWEITLP
jgi:pimeloyl-ACP methyl ester carboxylesterase